MDESLIKQLIASIKCGSCGQNYQEDNIDVLDHKDELWFLKVSCSSCHVRSLVAAIIREDSGPQFITDLTEAELEKFRQSGAINADDVLDMRNFLKDFEGDLPRLFRQE